DNFEVVVGTSGHIGAGGSTHVVAMTDEHLAARLPQARPERPAPYDANLVWHAGFVNGHRILSDLGVPVVRLHSAKRGQYSVVDRLHHIEHTAADTHNPQLSIADRNKRYDTLIDFAKKTAMFSRIDDFRVTQLRYSEAHEGWVLIDWGDRRF